MLRTSLSRAACLLGILCLPSNDGRGDATLLVSVANDRGELMLSWPGWATDAVLEQTTNARTPLVWSPIPPDLYQADATGFHHRILPMDTTGFYRVRRLPSPVVGLSGHWDLDEGSGDLGVDQTSSGATLQMTNTTWRPGRFAGGSLQFNGWEPAFGGSLAWVSNANYRALPPAGAPFTVSFWFCPDALPPGSQQLFSSHAPDGSSNWHVALNRPGPGTNLLVLTAGGSAVIGRTLLLPEQWHRLTVTYADGRPSVYLDSRLLAQGSANLLNTAGVLYFGGAPGISAGFSGRIDEICTYTHALSQEQISLKGLWHFDESARALAADGSIQGRPAIVVPTNAWVAGKTGSAIDLGTGAVTIPNDHYSLLPASGGEFSLSFWVRPRALPAGRSGLLSCTAGTNAGWQLTVDVEDSTLTWLEFTSTNSGGTLALRTPGGLTNDTWTKLDLTYNGGIATVYVNGTEVASESGAIRGARAPLLLGAVPGTESFDGVIDELKVYGHERQAAEIGPVALPMWETALMNSSTNLMLQGSGPPGKPLIYAVVPSPAPTRGTLSHSPGSPALTYQAGSQKGPDSFAYTVSDGEFTSLPATVVISVVQPHWLSPTGGNLSPLDGSSPERAWAAGSAKALDAVWKTNNYYDCFFYTPGEYHTTGYKFMERSTANPGCKHFGSGLEGPNATTIRLVDTWTAWSEGLIFAPLHQNAYCDGFEVRNLVLDCNAENNPKYTLGEPVWLSIPLTTTARVDQVNLHWSNTQAGSFRHGAAAQFALITRTAATNGYLTNVLAAGSTGQVDVVNLGTEIDELLVRLDRRSPGVDFYGLAELELVGASVSLPTALIPGGGESRLDAQHAILFAVDGDSGTSWASGPEGQVQISLPLAPGSALNQLDLEWNCQTLADLRRLGRAAACFILARDPNTGGYVDVPFVSHGRNATGEETVTLGSLEATNTIFTDQLVLWLTGREPGVDSYSLKEINLRNSASTVPLRVPTAVNTLATSFSILRAFDGDTSTSWASGTQGSVAAAEVRGSNLKFIGLRIVGFGTKAARECFALAVLAFAPSVYHPAPLTNVLVEDCVFTLPATNNSDGLSVLALVGQGPDRLRNAIARRCTVKGVKSHFVYSHGITAPIVENCLIDDCEVAVYFEPNPKGWADNIGPILIRSNQFSNVRFGITMDFHAQARFDSLAVVGNEIVLAGKDRPGFGVRICDVCSIGPSASTTNLTVLNNIIRYSDWGPRNIPDGGLDYGDIQHAVYGNNLLALAPANSLRVRPYPAGLIPDVPLPEDCDHPGIVEPGPSTIPPSVDALRPGYRRAWFNNRDLSGALLPVRHYAYGVDRLASQQQWPE